MRPLCFIDTETTSLRPDRRAWEIAVIRRDDEHEQDIEHHWLVNVEDLDLGNAELGSLRIGRFHDRHPQANGEPDYASSLDSLIKVVDEDNALANVEYLTRGAYVFAAVTSFDAEVLGNRMREHGICPSWHYRLRCIENLAVGFLRGRGERVDEDYDPEDLSRRLGIEPPSQEERHTALGDARWCRDMYDAMARVSDQHLIRFGPSGWTIQHPLACRPNLFACPVNKVAEQDLVGATVTVGVYECDLNDISDRFLIGDRVDIPAQP